MNEYAELKERILRRRPLCELCWTARATQLHHCLVHDSKRYHELVTVEENLMPVCERCHVGLASRANGYEVKREFAMRQVKQYNIDVSGWYRRLPIKTKEYWLLNLEGS